MQSPLPVRAVSDADAYAVDRCFDEMCVCTRSRSEYASCSSVFSLRAQSAEAEVQSSGIATPAAFRRASSEYASSRTASSVLSIIADGLE